MIEIPLIKIGCKEIAHNTVKWSVCTNRHTSTRGHAWGWIEGAPGNICWSNDDDIFTSRHAAEAVMIHNQWLEDQKPIVFRIIETEQKLASVIQQIVPLRKQLRNMEQIEKDLEDKLIELRSK